MNTAVFIMSCDKTNDVLDHFLKGINIYWKNNNLKVFIGANDPASSGDIQKPNFIFSPKTNWKIETLNQLYQIKEINPTITHLLVMLDDFILNRTVNNESLLEIIKQVEKKNINYLRLKRLEDSIFLKFFQVFSGYNLVNNIKIFKIRNTHPYYSSLQVALWNIDYLISIIVSIDNIWEFELQNKNPNSHYSVYTNIFSYKHIVEKGKWEIYAQKYCIKYINYFNKGNREQQASTFVQKIIKIIQRIKFFFFGYLFSRKFNLK